MSEGIAPCDVRSTRDVLRLERSAWDGAGYWMSVNHDGSVSINAQRNGEERTQHVVVPRRQFLAMLDWYHKRQS